MEKKWSIELADGSSLKGLRLNGNNFISAAKVTADTFAGKLSHITISDGELIEEYDNMELVQINRYGTEYWFVLRELSAREIKELKMQANIEYIAMMADIDLEEV